MAHWRERVATQRDAAIDRRIRPDMRLDLVRAQALASAKDSIQRGET